MFFAAAPRGLTWLMARYDIKQPVRRPARLQ
jgi:hypothetical protein